MAIRYAALGEEGRRLYLYESNRTTKVRQVLWGDFLDVEQEEADGWLKVIWARSSPTHRRELYIPKADTVEERPLELIFVDVGQGDGAVLITPERGQDERIVVIDAGEGDNMYRFLNGRFRAYRGFEFAAAVITHPDKDHYKGFEPIFEDHDIGFETVYQNGLVERPVSGQWEKIGGKAADPATGVEYVTDLAVDDELIELHFRDSATFGKNEFPPLMKAAIDNPKIGKFRMLSTEHGQRQDGRSWMPGFAPSDDRRYTIEVLGPVVEPDAAGAPRLRRIGSYGETKNGHSILLKLRFGRFGVLLGGDLNHKAEEFLLAHYAGIPTIPKPAFPKVGSQAYKDMLADVSSTFRCDIMKICHHGSEKVTDAFLNAVNPAAFVISSGDQEGHVHPRPDLLGRLGRAGRGDAPVLLSTELQRSTREIEDPAVVEALIADIAKLRDTPSASLCESIQDRVKKLARLNVEVYGAIYLKTDGERLITAFKIEDDSDTKKWFYFEYVFDEDGNLKLV